MEPTRQLAELLDRERELLARGGEQVRRGAWVLVKSRLNDLQLERQRDEPLLRPVVKVALETPPLYKKIVPHLD